MSQLPSGKPLLKEELGPAPDIHVQVPCSDLFSAVLTIWLTGPVTSSWHLIPATALASEFF